ncbi:seven transmembrane MLO family protein, partial [Striga asiatica]
ITPEEAESLRKSHRPAKASREKPVHVSGHPPHTVYSSRPNTTTHQEKLSVSAVPIIPSWSRCTTSQLRSSWLCRNLCSGNCSAKLKCSGMKHSATSPDSSATSAGCPTSFSIGLANISAGSITRQHAETHDDVAGDGHGGEFEVAEVAGKGLSDDEHGIGGDAADDGGAHHAP